MSEAAKRKQGHSKLVYDKATRTIISVDPHPTDPVITDEMVSAFICSWFGLKPDDVWTKQDRFKDAERALHAALSQQAPSPSVPIHHNLSQDDGAF